MDSEQPQQKRKDIIEWKVLIQTDQLIYERFHCLVFYVEIFIYEIISVECDKSKKISGEFGLFLDKKSYLIVFAILPIIETNLKEFIKMQEQW